MRTVRIGSRESKLAVKQAEIVMEAIRRRHPEISLELVTMKTTGDRILDRTVDQIGGKGLFVKELDEALATGRVDLCVHSYKDMPMEENPDFPVVAVSRREDPRDALLLPNGAGLPRTDIPAGCSSKRRKLQFHHLYPDWEVRPVRGNILSRLDKMDRGEYGGLVLAAAGIIRLGLWGRVNRVFEPKEILPCACQGILAVQGRRGEPADYLEEFHDRDAWDISVAERAFIRTLDGGCSSPAAAYARLHGQELRLEGLHVDEQGNMHRDIVTGLRTEGERLGEELARRLLRRAEGAAGKRGVEVG